MHYDWKQISSEAFYNKLRIAGMLVTRGDVEFYQATFLPILSDFLKTPLEIYFRFSYSSSFFRFTLIFSYFCLTWLSFENIVCWLSLICTILVWKRIHSWHRVVSWREIKQNVVHQRQSSSGNSNTASIEFYSSVCK